MLGDIVVTAAVAIVLVLLFIGTVPIAGTRAWRWFWAFIVLGGALAVAVWPAVRPKPTYGWYAVINDSASPVIAQLESPGPYNAWLIGPGERGPMIMITVGRAIGVYSTGCELIGRTKIEGYFRGTVLHLDGSMEVIDLGDMSPANVTPADGCPARPRMTLRDAD